MFFSCLPQSRNVGTLSPKPSSSFAPFLSRLRGTISCTAFMSARKSRLGFWTSEVSACTAMRPFGRSLVCREHCLVVGSAAIPSGNSEIHRARLRVLRWKNGSANRRMHRTCCSYAEGWSFGSRVSRGTVEGSSRVTISNNLRIHGIRVSNRNDRAFQGPAHEKTADQSVQPTVGSVTPRANSRPMKRLIWNPKLSVARIVPAPRVTDL